MNVRHISGKLFWYELWILRRNEVWNIVRKTHKNGYMSYVECRMLPINAMVTWSINVWKCIPKTALIISTMCTQNKQSEVNK